MKTVLQSLFVSAWFVCLREAFAVEKKETAEENENSIRKIQFDTVIGQELQRCAKDRSLLNEKKCSRSGNQGLMQGYYYERLIGDFSFQYCFGGQTFHGDTQILLRYIPQPVGNEKGNYMNTTKPSLKIQIR